MKKKHLYWIVPLILIVGIVVGITISFLTQERNLGNYDLYQCIWDNARLNGFPQSDEMIDKIQDECVCFRESNYNLTEFTKEGGCLGSNGSLEVNVSE